MRKLEDYIQTIEDCETPDQAFKKYCDIVKQLGYDRVVYSLMTDHPSLNLPKQHGLVSSYPEHWVNFYNDNNYMDHDPVAKLLLKTNKPFFWSDLLSKQDISVEAQRVMNEAAESNINDGLAFAMPGSFGEVTAFGLARSVKENNQKKDYNTLSAVHLISIYFHELFRSEFTIESPVTLTDKEKDILQFACDGKTDDVIAEILGISFHTVRFHWKKIFNKLSAHGRTYAITKAIRLGLIQPAKIRLHY